jgi:two-component system invasion response regulator UvrY
MEVVGQARSPERSGGAVRGAKPDVAVLDIRFGTELTGMDAAQNILRPIRRRRSSSSASSTRTA